MTPERLRQGSLACLAALPLLHLAWHVWWSPPTVLPLALVLSIAIAPAALALLACWHDRGYGLVLGGIFCLFYFSHGAMEAWAAPADRLPALLEVALAAGQILLLAAAAMKEKRARRAAAPTGA
jgi:uncharacterized membrane protein